jgi:hypothetical protein
VRLSGEARPGIKGLDQKAWNVQEEFWSHMGGEKLPALHEMSSFKVDPTKTKTA